MKNIILVLVIWGAFISSLIGFNDKTNYGTCDWMGNPFYLTGCIVAEHTDLATYRTKLLGGLHE